MNYRPAVWSAAFGTLLGVGAMYWLDPQHARRRRAIARDKLGHWRRQGVHLLGVGGRDLAHRTHGVFSRGRTLLVGEHDLTDDVVEGRVRSRLGRLVSHPHAIEVHSDRGRVTLKGVVLSREVPRLLREVAEVGGVRAVENRLEPHRPEEHHPSLQGGRRRVFPRLNIRQSNWAPATRLLVDVTSAGLLAFAWQQRNNPRAPAALSATLGLVGLVRSLTNQEFTRVLWPRWPRGY